MVDADVMIYFRLLLQSASALFARLRAAPLRDRHRRQRPPAAWCRCPVGEVGIFRVAIPVTVPVENVRPLVVPA